MNIKIMNTRIIQTILILLTVILCSSQHLKPNNIYNSCSKINWELDSSNKADSLFAIAFEKMKTFYMNAIELGPNPFKPDYLEEFENVLQINPNHIPALMNSFYITLRYRYSDYINISHNYLEKLLQIDKENSLFELFKFSEYEKLIWLAYHDEGWEKYPIVQEAIDSLSFLANKLYNKYDCYSIKTKTLPYVEFKSFKERETALISLIHFISDNNNRKKLLNNLDHFIEKYASEGGLFFSFTILFENDIRDYIIHFYDYFLDDKYFHRFLTKRCGIKFDLLENRIPNFDGYPNKYKIILKKRFNNKD